MNAQIPVRTVSILGCGWFGLPLGIRLNRAGFQVKGSTTSEDKLKLLHDNHIEGFLLDFDPGINQGAMVDGFFNSDVLVINIPPGRGTENPASRYRLIMSNVLPHVCASTIRLVIFVSSTSVYADCNKVVNENDAGGVISESGKALLESERLVQLRPEFSTTVLRFAGLYGLDRHPVKYLAGRTGLKNGEAPINLVHLEDCIRVTERVIRRQLGGETFNVVSDEHPSRKRYYTEMARRLGMAKPVFDESSPADAWKQVSNRHLKSTLNYSFKYPSPYDGP